LYRQLRAEFRRGRWDLYLPIDYPGFHLRAARVARRAGTRVLYYIPPQLWAWRPGRARLLAAAVDRLAVVLPFEPAYFAGLGLSAEYVGHPLLDRPPPPSRMAARAALGIPVAARVLALFPGSREQEVRSHWETFLAVADRLRAEGRCDEVVVAVTPAGSYPAPGGARLHPDARTVLAAADACLAKSGTTTLEAALADVPMAVAYRMNPLTFAVARRVVTVQWVSLVNLVVGREVVPEFLQEAMTVPALTTALADLLAEGHPARMAQLQGLAEVRARLGAPGASARVAAIAGELLDS
jgi:lipid-A-disaccharide synthase